MAGKSKGDLYFDFTYDESRAGSGIQDVIQSYAQDLKKNPTYDSWARYIPVWGAAKQAQLDFSVGKYGWGTFNTVMAISDVALLRLIFGGIVKAVGKEGIVTGTSKYFGIGYSNEYGASVSRWKKLGVDMSGIKHHWLISQKLMEQYPWLKPIGNQTWNLTKFESEAAHSRWGHFTAYPSLQLSKIPGARILYPIAATPTWFKLGLGTSLAKSFEQ